MSQRVNIIFTSNTQTITLPNVIIMKKARVSYCRYITANSGNKDLYILLDNFNIHPVYGGDLPFSYYFKMVPLYSGSAMDFLYTNEVSPDVVLPNLIQFSQFKITALINGSYMNADISPSNPMNIELLFEE